MFRSEEGSRPRELSNDIFCWNSSGGKSPQIAKRFSPLSVVGSGKTVQPTLLGGTTSSQERVVRACVYDESVKHVADLLSTV